MKSFFKNFSFFVVFLLGLLPISAQVLPGAAPIDEKKAILGIVGIIIAAVTMVIFFKKRLTKSN